MNDVVYLNEWKQKKAAKRETVRYEFAEDDFTHYEEILEKLNLLPGMLVARVVKYCLAHHVSFEDLSRKCDF